MFAYSTRMNLARAPSRAGWRIAIPAPGSFLLSPCAEFNAAACCAGALCGVAALGFRNQPISSTHLDPKDLPFLPPQGPHPGGDSALLHGMGENSGTRYSIVMEARRCAGP